MSATETAPRAGQSPEQAGQRLARRDAIKTLGVAAAAIAAPACRDAPASSE